MRYTTYRFHRTISRLTLITVALFQIIFTPLALTAYTHAEEAAPPATDPASTSTGPTSPTGADSSTYVYNETTGLWENDFYTWDPVTKQTKPKQTPTYSYNPETGYWDTTEWRYDTAAGKYVPNTVSTPPTPTNPAPADSTNTTTPKPATQSSFQADSQIQALGGPDDDTTATSNSNTSGYFDLFYNANISHDITLDATSGSVDIYGNTLAGNGTSGSADSMANIINMLQSSWNPEGGIGTFTVDINGDVYGDFYFDPSQFSGALDTSTTTIDNDYELNVENTAHMDNDIEVNATSGNVSADSNTEVGDLSSGTAHAVANVVNMINSMVSAGDSFIGTINIHGNYEGDILLPEESIRALLASNDIPKSTINISQIQNNQTVVDINNDQNITNNVTANANTGDVSLSGNTNAGSATSGDSNTNITVLNLTGQQVVGSNALLVFVNVLGEWVGMIVNAPAGSTAAALGSGDSNTTVNNSAEIDVDNQFEIENNITLNANSGDVTGSHNTNVGDATSGDATASANITNMTNSSLSLSNWFGLLFINVFGKWHGSFGINTEAGNRQFVPPATTTETPSAVAPAKVEIMRFVPSEKPVATTSEDQSEAVEAISEALDGSENTSGILGASTSDNGSGGFGAPQGGFNWSSIAPVGLLALLVIAGTEGVATLINRRKSHA